MKTMNPKHALALALGAALVPAMLVGCDGAQAPAAVEAPQEIAAEVAPAKPANVQPVADDAQRVLQLEGAWNVRNFAGLQGANGPIPAGAFQRTADLGRLTAADLDKLAAAGVSLDIDLRTADEDSRSRDKLADDSRFAYQRISLMGTEKMDPKELIKSMPDSLGQAYVQWLDGNHAPFLQVFQTIAAQDKGTVLFHCTAGKDRTGVIAALLLDLAGVPRADIVHDYALSAHYLEGQPKDSAMNAQFVEMMRNNPELAKKMAGMSGTSPENMELFLDALSQRHGNAEGFLKAIGLGENEIRQLKVRLGQAG